MGMRIVTSSAFEAVSQDGLEEVLIDHQLTEQFFPNGNPIGAKFHRTANTGSPPSSSRSLPLV